MLSQQKASMKYESATPSLDKLVSAFENNQPKVRVNSDGLASLTDDQLSYNY